MENVRISNELVRKDERILFLEDENRCIEQKTRDACAAEIACLKAELESLRGAKEVAEIATQANIDYKSIIRLIQRRQFNRNSDATRFLKGEINPDDPYFNEMGFESVIKAVMAETDGALTILSRLRLKLLCARRQVSIGFLPARKKHRKKLA